MYTEKIFVSVVLFVLGSIFGKFFEELNPIVIFGGCILFLPVLFFLADADVLLYNIFFGLGFLTLFKSPFSKVFDFLSEIKIKFQLAAANKNRQRIFEEENRKQEERRKEAERETRRQEEYIKKEKENLRREKASFRTEQEQETYFKQEEERLKREKENLKKQQEDLRKKQTRHHEEVGANMPTTFDEACEILGVSQSEKDFNVFKKARVEKTTKYHPDKCSHLGEKLKKKANIETKKINVAWEIVKATFK